MDFQKIKRIIKMVEEADIASLKISSDDSTIEVTKATQVVAQAPNVVTTVQAQAPAAPVAVQAEPEGVADAVDDGDIVIESPMVGTVYLAPKPEEPNFVSAGQTVSKGSVLCLVEAMKLFNEIESEVSGSVTKVLVENGQTVEYGQPLFAIKP
ncbi:MAG: acetyl-CoA carboxylase biotin carboxyl carrier protein [bacterium]|nr:acetyl-CoA carboxylase biotin carboxyl carrier protein [bacterium]